MASGSVAQKSPGSHTYTYSSQPRSVPQRQKYRDAEDDDKQVLYGNIMYDRRIIRGNTYAVNQLPATSKPDPVEFKRQQEAQRRQLAKKRARERMRESSPKPVEGRKHIDVQTELYLEEITDRVEEADVQTQTDAFLNRPATPLFIPAKTGADVATQIEEGDLFDFDIEVKPILEVLVGKTVEQALMEVMEEEELASLRAQQREFEENRNAELVETQRLEEQERRHREEKERRMHQQREALLKEKETAEKIAARAFAQSYLNDLVPSVFSILYDSGYFYDTTEREIETTFMPWLMDQVGLALEKKIVARMMVDAMIKDIVMKKLGIQPQQASSETLPETTTETSKEVVSEAGKDDTEDLAIKAESTEDSKGTEQDETTSEKPTETDQKKVFGEQGDKPESESEPKTDTEPKSDSEPKTDTEPKADVDSKGETEPPAEGDSKAETEPKTDVDSKAETDPKTDADSKPETEPTVEGDSKAETESKTDIDSKPETEATAEGDSKTVTEPKSETEPKTDVDPKPEDSKSEEPASEPVTTEETKEEQKETEPTEPPTSTEEPGTKTDEQTMPPEGDTTEQPKDQEDTN